MALDSGNPWQEAGAGADSAGTCAVFIGPDGVGPWEHVEMRGALDDRVTRPGFRVIPVLLPGAVLPQQGGAPVSRELDLGRLSQRAPGSRGLPSSGGWDSWPLARPWEPVRLPAGPSVCPYQGLARFDEAQAPFFFGREADTQHLVEHLRTQRFLAVVGPSGSGKSSIIRAGVLPQLRQGVLPGSAGWTYLVCTPGAHPWIPWRWPWHASRRRTT